MQGVQHLVAICQDRLYEAGAAFGDCKTLHIVFDLSIAVDVLSSDTGRMLTTVPPYSGMRQVCMHHLYQVHTFSVSFVLLLIFFLTGRCNVFQFCLLLSLAVYLSCFSILLHILFRHSLKYSQLLLVRVSNLFQLVCIC